MSSQVLVVPPVDYLGESTANTIGHFAKIGIYHE